MTKNTIIEELSKTIIEELSNRGYKAQFNLVVKNGVEFPSVIVGDGNVRPNIYIDDLIEQYDSLDEVVDVIIEMYEKTKNETFDINGISEWDYVKTRLQLCLQKKGDENIVKRDFLDLEQYVRVIVDAENKGSSSFKVNPSFLKTWNVTEDILFNAAWDCTKPTLVKRDMMDIMEEMGVSVAELKETCGEMQDQIIISNKSGINGSIAMFDTWMLGEIADKYESDLVILPSSIHEIIATPITDKVLFRYDKMVQEVNEEQLYPEEVLSNHAYRFNRDTREITF